jgi:TetR/AcrR family transcriptional regulator, tetracycline repressor protein
VASPPSAGEGLQISFALGGYIGGMALEAQSAAARDEPSSAESGEGSTVMSEALASGQYPHLEAAAKGLSKLDPDTVFSYGLDLMMRGIRARLVELETDRVGSRKA